MFWHCAKRKNVRAFGAIGRSVLRPYAEKDVKHKSGSSLRSE
jgi:hypothetical protein